MKKPQLSEMQEQEEDELQFCEISKDSALQELFNQYEGESNILHLQNQNEHHQLFKMDAQNVEKGYWSDCNEKPSKYFPRKQKYIINKKQKRRNRHRTKNYISMLQNRVDQLELEMQKLNKLNKINKEYIHRLSQSEQIITGFFIGRQQMYEQLESCTTDSEESEQQASQIIKSLRLRQGSLGIDRLKAINYYFKEMVELMLPEIQKYIIKTANQESDFFEKQYLVNGRKRKPSQKWENILQSINEGSQKISLRKYLTEKRNSIVKQINKFEQILLQFYDKKCQLTQQARKIEVIFDDADSEMNISQIKQALCYVDRYRFEKNISLSQVLPCMFQKLKGQNFIYQNGFLKNKQNCQ